MRKFLWLVVILFFTGCGYKPASHYTKRVFGQKIYTQVSVYLRDPENAVLVKDAVNEAILKRLSGSLVAKSRADTIMRVAIASVSFTPLQYDENGYVIYYRTKVLLKTDITDKSGQTRHIKATGVYDFPIEPNSVITDNLRYVAIKEASAKAIDAIISRLAYLGSR
ncbi:MULTISPECIES: LPS assembly lipoprotein LptE [unclassified Nitratiruptor]|uniref:LPS assembly lipoprotein LptE n=1 Tax=unclassified Nitratiruptor TaxID=2624044 RepID=UPI0019158242|nr:MULTISPECIES: LPS assembly lipoprotein LptE [unclassified Nitratiruptor]BCD60765.1 hypothetical protein NitYY0810_C1543 [Nitratiruptor sp. YY08-10]BCD64697.1 hypothetical protein NitYY0814_C1551 [Nitratiruptor sp. YY08-14]